MFLMSALLYLTGAMALFYISLWISRKKFLMTLINLEIVILIIFLCQIIVFKQNKMMMTPALFLLVMGACEASLGLSLLIQSTRFKGNDMLNNKETKF